MYGNVPDRFIPETIPEPIYANPLIDYGRNSQVVNAYYEVLEKGIAENGWGDRTAVHSIETDERITYDELRSRVNRFAMALRELGICEGERVFWRFGEVPYAQIAQLAIWQIGAVGVSYVPQARSREIEYFLNDMEAAALVTTDQGLDEVEEALGATPTVREVIVAGDTDHDYHSFDELLDGDELPSYVATDPSDVATIVYTGGTTGRPKGCIHSHVAEVAMTDLEGVEGRALTEEDVTFCPSPIAHAHGRGEKVNGTFRFGASTILVDRPTSREILEVIEEYGVTIFRCVPTLLRMITHDVDVGEYDLSSIRLNVVSGERLDEETLDNWKESTGIELANAVGGTAHLHTYLSSYRSGEKFAPGTSVGKPYAGFDGRLVAEDDPRREVGRNELGRLSIRGPTNVTYWNNLHPDMPGLMDRDLKDGWTLLDDAYERDGDGFLYFRSRLDDLIVSGARQISPLAVEEALYEREEVEEVAVIGVPDELRTEIVKAFVKLHEGVPPSDELKAELQQYCKTTLAPYKYPREIEFVDEFPKNPVGKINRSKLRDD